VLIFFRIPFLVLLVLIRIQDSSCVLASYTAALQPNNGLGRDDLIKNYFQQDYTNVEIAGFLALCHGTIISVRSIKRVLKRLHLKRASHRNGHIIIFVIISFNTIVSCHLLCRTTLQTSERVTVRVVLTKTTNVFFEYGIC